MKLELKAIGDTSTFVDWLKKFSKINQSLLLEIDIKQKAFIAKTFTEDKASIRFAKINFDECNLEIIENKSQDIKTLDSRIKLGVLLMLPKFIKMIESFSGEFDIIVEYDNIKTQTGNDVACTSIAFKSDELKMKIDGFKLSEFKYLSDDIFNNNIHIASNPITIQLTDDIIKNILKFSSVNAVDDKSDQLLFYSDTDDTGAFCIYVKDDNNSFAYKIGQIDLPYSFELSIFRYKFSLFMKDMSEPFKLTIGQEQDRILLDSELTETKMIISIINS